MRADNLIIVVLGLAAIAFAVAVTIRWGSLPTRSATTVVPPEGSARTGAFATAGWSLAAVLAAGAVAGIVVGGLVGRLIMRVTAAVSPPEAQGQLTDAEEVVGEITLGGTIGFVVFVGLFGGVAASGLYLLARPWLPETAWVSGLIIGIVVMGVLGPGDPLDSENVDFALLSHDGLSVAMIIGGSLLFGLAFASLAARFQVLAERRSRRRFLLLPAYVVALIGPVGLAAIVYLGGRTFLPGRLRPFLDRRPVQVAGRAVVCLLVVAMAIRLGIAAVDILRL